MSNDVADETPAGETRENPLSVSALIGALARAIEEHQASVITPRKDDPKGRLVAQYGERQQKDYVVEIDGEEVGTYKVSTTRARFEVDDQAAFDAYADRKGEIDIVITAKPAFVTAALRHAVRNPETGTIFDSRTGEEIPGLRFVPGGKPTGSVTFKWKTFKGEPIGKGVLLAAYRNHRLDEYLRETPELLPRAQPGASDD
ncbi:hypothetical protein [Streptomyces similanensis]|uniref:Restriction endonuclease n=1 Tax=Streptomyces similanensis TaxID=1274988 RepID=A0ABP9L3I6_9ACTN